jgi:hypothetical protein
MIVVVLWSELMLVHGMKVALLRRIMLLCSRVEMLEDLTSLAKRWKMRKAKMANNLSSASV